MDLITSTSFQLGKFDFVFCECYRQFNYLKHNSQEEYMKKLIFFRACALSTILAITSSIQAQEQTSPSSPLPKGPAHKKGEPRDDLGFSISADFLYWTVRQDGMFYAVSGVGTNPSKGTVHDLDWKMKPGFKIGLGLDLPHDNWDLFAEYTWIKSEASDSTVQNAGTSTLTSYWAVNGAVAFLQNARANWDINFQNLNLELGRNTALSPYLNLRPHFGLQGTRINQDYDATYLTTTNLTQKIKQDQDFWGVGLRAGFDTSWHITQNFSLLGDLIVSILWGEFDLERKETQITAADVSTVVLHTAVSPKTFEPVIELFAGARWETPFGDNDRFNFLLQAGWEQQIWILQNEYIKRMPETDHSGDLILQGLTVKAKFDF